MKNFLRISFFLAFFSAYYSVFASTWYPAVSCGAFGASANSCNQCFDGGTLYQGQYVTNMFDDFTAGNQQTAIFANNPGSVRTEYVQNGFTWSESASMWTLNSDLFSSFSATRGWYIALQPNQVASAYVKSAPGTGLQFVSGPSSGGSRDIPSFKLTYDTTYYTKATGFATPESHKECVFYKSNWCGDGVVDSAKEDCDLGSQNGVTGSSCPINCKLAPFDLSLKKYVLGQDAQNGSPVTVTRGQTIDYTFQARNNGASATIGRTTVSDIALPTGVSVISVTGAGWTCTSNTSSFSCYTDTIFQSGVNLPLITLRAQVSNTAVYGSPLMNYACVQNGDESRINNFGNNNCDEANIIITPPSQIACVPGTTTGNQVNPINGASPGLCPAGKVVGDFVATPTGSTLVYSWSCDGSIPGGLCQATYTPSIGVCTPGPIRGVQPSPITSSTAGLCPVGQAVTGFTSTTVGTTTTYAWGCGTSTFGGLCQATYTSSLTNFDLSLKKYVNNINQDAQDGFPVAFGTGSAFNYLIRVTNNGAAGVSGTTTVSDPGPATGVNFTGTPSGSGWNCTLSGRAISCTSNSTIASWANFPDITVPATTTNALGTFRNLATVANPNENPINNFGNNNSDEANVIVTATAGICTPGTTTGIQTTAVTATTAGLCPAGQTVGGFTSTTAGATTNYSWSCNGSPVGGLCVASFTPTAGICTPGTTTGIQTTAVTATTAGLCPAGQAVGGFTSTTVGTTTNYSWSCNGSPVGGLCVASFTPTAGICTSLTASVTSQTVSTYSSVLTCTAGAGAWANPTFQINCGNGQIINAATGTCNYIAYGTNSAFCSVNGQTGVAIPNACRVNITSNPPGGSGPGTCEQLSFSTLSNVNNILSIGMSCTATAAAQPNPTFEIDCGNGQTINGNTGICGYSLIGNTRFPYTATCRVNGSTQGAPSASPGIFAPGSCRQSISYSDGPPVPTGGGSDAYCGNGIVDSWTKTFTGAQIPGATCTPVYRTVTTTSSTGVVTTSQVLDYYSCVVRTTETCDAGWLNGAPVNNLLCVGCQTQNNVTTTNPSSNPLMISYHPVDRTRPQGLMVNNYQWIVGNNVSVFDSGDRFTISSPYPTILSGYTATMENDSNLINPANANVSNPFGNNECIGSGQIDFGAGPRNCTASKTLFTVAAGGTVTPAFGGVGQKYTGNTTSITANAAQDVNPLLSSGSTVLQNNFTVGIGYLREPLKVRVARQAVSNTAGGNAYIGARTGYSVNAITNEFLSSIKSGNFVVTSSASSNSNALSGADSASVTNTSQNLTVGSNGSATTTRDVTVASTGDFNFANFAKMGDASNIYHIKKGTVTITGDIRLKGIGTLLIEEGTLVINGNVTYEDANSSWAFIVVKPGTSGASIQIKNTVETISGVYMALAGEMTGSAASIVQLSVDGNVYANIASLVNSRTFIRATEGSSALSTGVTINYSTRAFKNPPPLLSKYLEQYTLRKVSR